MAFGQEVNDFINAFGAMQKILGTKSSREAERAKTDYTRAATDKLRWDMGEDDRLETDVLSSMDGGVSGGGGDDALAGGTGGFNVASGVDMSGLTPQMRNAWGGAINALPPELRNEIKAISAYRDVDKQARIRASGVRPAATAGNSWHQFGQAIDASGSARALAALYKIAPRFGLANPVPNDPNHFQLVNHGGVTRGIDAARAYQASLRGGGGGDFRSGGSAGADRLGGGLPDVEALTDYIRQAATKRGIDPDTAVRVAQSEGLSRGVWQSNIVNPRTGERERSYGPFQLNIGGGLGDKFAKLFGDPSDPSTVYDNINFALDEAAEQGWTPWHGAAARGIGPRDGLEGARALREPSYRGGGGGTPSGVIQAGEAGSDATRMPDALAAEEGIRTGLISGPGAPDTDENLAEVVSGTWGAIPPQVSDLNKVLEAGGGFPGQSPISVQPPTPRMRPEGPPSYTVGADLSPVPDTGRIEQLQAVQAIDENRQTMGTVPSSLRGAKDDALSESRIGPRLKDDSVREMLNPPSGRTPAVIDITPEVDYVLQSADTGAGGLAPEEAERARGVIAANIARSHRVTGDTAPIIFDGQLMVEDPNSGEFVLATDSRVKDDAVTLAGGPGIAEARTKDDAFAPPTAVAGGPPPAATVPLPPARPPAGGAPPATTVAAPPPRPEGAPVPGTEPVSGTPGAEAVPTGFDPLPQTPGAGFDPVSGAGHEAMSPSSQQTLTNAARGVPNRHRVPFREILKKIKLFGREVFNIQDEGVDTNDDHPGKSAQLTGFGGMNIHLIKSVEDKIREGNPNIGEEQLRMEVISTLWNYFYERGDYKRGDALAWAAHQSYLAIADKYLHLAKVNVEEGNLEQGIQNYLAAFGMVPDGDIVDARVMPDGSYEMTVKDADTGKVSVQSVKKPEEIAADIMNMETEDFQSLIERKIRGADAEETDAEKRRREAEEALTESPMPPTVSPDEEAVPTTPPTAAPGSAGSDDLVDEAIPEVAEAPSIVTDVAETGDVSGEGEGGISEVTPGITSPAEPPASSLPGYPGPIDAVSPPKPVSTTEFNDWLKTQPVSVWNDRFQQRNAQEKAYNDYWKVQAKTQQDQLKAAEAERNRMLIQTVTNYMAAAPATSFLDVQEDMLGAISDTEDRNSLRSLWELRNKNALELRGLSETELSSKMLTEGMIQLDGVKRQKVTPPKGGGDDTGAVQLMTGEAGSGAPAVDFSKLKPGQFTPDMFLNPVEGGLRQIPIPQPNQNIRSMLRGDDLKTYDTALKDAQKYAEDYNKTFYPPPLTAEQQRPKPIGPDDTTWMETFVGDRMAMNEGAGLVTSGDGSTGGMLGKWLAFNSKVKNSPAALAANVIKGEILDSPSLQGSIGSTATDLVNMGMNELDAFTTVTNMLTIPATSPFDATYKVMPHPDDPRMVSVQFITPGRPVGGDDVVTMPRATYETLDEWHGILQARYLNSLPSPDTPAPPTAPSETNAISTEMQGTTNPFIGESQEPVPNPLEEFAR